MVDGFINLALDLDSLPHYVIRRGILESLRQNLGVFRGTVVDIGCGRMPYRELISASGCVTGYIGLDLDGAAYDVSVQADVRWDGVSLPLRDDSCDSALLTEVLEHCPAPTIVLSEAARVLRDGGTAFLTVPFLYPVHEAPNDFRRFTARGLEQAVLDSGFSSCRVFSYGGYHAAMAQMLGLWVSYTGFSRWRRKLLGRLAVPVVRYLVRKDRGCDPSQNRAIFPGLCAVASV